MLNDVLLRHMIRSLVWLVGPAAILMGLIFGWDHAFGLVVGAAIIGLSVGGLVFIVGRLLDPTEASGRKTGFTILLMLKMTTVAALLWLSMSRWGVSGFGILFGIGVGLVAIQMGLVQGADSVEGKRAIEETEARIREEFGDSDDESR